MDSCLHLSSSRWPFFSPLESPVQQQESVLLISATRVALLSSFLRFPDYHNICIPSMLGHSAGGFRAFA